MRARIWLRDACGAEPHDAAPFIVPGRHRVECSARDVESGAGALRQRGAGITEDAHHAAAPFAAGCSGNPSSHAWNASERTKGRLPMKMRAGPVPSAMRWFRYRRETRACLAASSIVKSSKPMRTPWVMRKSNHSAKAATVQAYSGLCLYLQGVIAGLCG